VPAAFESIRKPEGPYLSIRRDNNSHPKKVAQAISIMAASPFYTKLKTSLNRRVFVCCGNAITFSRHQLP
jgi:hypothetical protein